MGLVPMIPHNRVKLAVQYVSFAYNIEQHSMYLITSTLTYEPLLRTGNRVFLNDSQPELLARKLRREIIHLRLTDHHCLISRFPESPLIPRHTCLCDYLSEQIGLSLGHPFYSEVVMDHRRPRCLLQTSTGSNS